MTVASEAAPATAPASSVTPPPALVGWRGPAAAAHRRPSGDADCRRRDLLHLAGAGTSADGVVSLYGLFNDRATVSKHIDLLVGIVPAGGLDIIRDQLTRLTSAPPAALSLTLVGSLLVALWSSSAGIKALFDAMNVAYEEEEKRNFFVINGLALLFTIGGVAAVLVTLGAGGGHPSHARPALSRQGL